MNGDQEGSGRSWLQTVTRLPYTEMVVKEERDARPLAHSVNHHRSIKAIYISNLFKEMKMKMDLT